jgi:hypothetical protein
MTNTDYADDDMLPFCGLVSIIEALSAPEAASSATLPLRERHG